MGVPLRVMIVEDQEDDALLLLRVLRRAGYDLTFERVDTAATMEAALDRQASGSTTRDSLTRQTGRSVSSRTMTTKSRLSPRA